MSSLSTKSKNETTVQKGKTNHQTFSAVGTISEINKVLKNPNKDYFFELAEFCEQLEKARDSFCEQNYHNPELLFQKMSQFLNVMFRTFYVKRLYNRTPNISLEDYSDSGLYQQFLNNVVDRKHSLLTEKLIQGGSCEHWAIFIKQCIDSRNIPGVETKYFLYNQNHWFVGIKFGEKFYIADTLDTKANPIVREQRGEEKKINADLWKHGSDTLEEGLLQHQKIDIMFSLTKKQKFSLTIYEKGVIINTIPYVFKNLTLDKIKYLEGLEMDQLLRKLFESVRTDEIYEEIFPYIPMLAQKINKTTLLTILSKGVKPTET